jgi:hypothetical protein
LTDWLADGIDLSNLFGLGRNKEVDYCTGDRTGTPTGQGCNLVVMKKRFLPRRNCIIYPQSNCIIYPQSSLVTRFHGGRVSETNGFDRSFGTKRDSDDVLRRGFVNGWKSKFPF